MEVEAPRLREKSFYKNPNKAGSVVLISLRKINTGKNKVFPVLCGSGVGKDQWRGCNPGLCMTWEGCQICWEGA